MARKMLFDLIESASKEEKDVADDFVLDLTYAIQKFDKMNERPASPTISPSQMKCERAMVYKLTSVPMDKQENSYQLINICQSGTDRHQDLQNTIYHMKELGLDIEYVNVKDYIKKNKLPLEIKKPSNFSKGEYETKLYSEQYRASFLCDGIIKYKGKYYILEIKTESTRKFQSQEDVMDAHKNQATAYSLLLGIDDVMFLYENRDVCTKKAYIYTPSADDKRRLTEVIERCIRYADEGKIPMKPYTANKTMCEYCNYKEKCAADG